MALDSDVASSEWLLAWVTGRALARGLPLPFADRGGWRAEIGSDSERRRWVFDRISDDLLALAGEIREPGLNLRVLAESEDFAAALPGGWRVGPPSFAMVGPARRPSLAGLVDGYRIETQGEGTSLHVFALAASGELAASGHAGNGPAAFVYDRIVTHPAHRRRGLASVVMATLGSMRTGPAKPQLLVATEMGRPLYEKLGWRVIAPYASAGWVGDSPVQN